MLEIVTSRQPSLAVACFDLLSSMVASQMSAEEDSHIKSLAAEVASEEKQRAVLRKSAAGLQAKADQLTAAMEAAGGDMLRNQKELVEQMHKVIHDCNFTFLLTVHC